eukprot:TRINITY_DN25131_c0_g1_i1.p2 TRINITY_DN25131_c0_g1~~TRINITY_DN25131_c0_g1_i1.p2  ORF type:complete len:103 (+),score=12.55 TRINITY_DN25131_c0_g1_i1:199-507(+)
MCTTAQEGGLSGYINDVARSNKQKGTSRGYCAAEVVATILRNLGSWDTIIDLTGCNGTDLRFHLQCFPLQADNNWLADQCASWGSWKEETPRFLVLSWWASP